jgi:hypothetical protein
MTCRHYDGYTGPHLAVKYSFKGSRFLPVFYLPFDASIYRGNFPTTPDLPGPNSPTDFDYHGQPYAHILYTFLELNSYGDIYFWNNTVPGKWFTNFFDYDGDGEVTQRDYEIIRFLHTITRGTVGSYSWFQPFSESAWRQCRPEDPPLLDGTASCNQQYRNTYTGVSRGIRLAATADISRLQSIPRAHYMSRRGPNGNAQPILFGGENWHGEPVSGFSAHCLEHRRVDSLNNLIPIGSEGGTFSPTEGDVYREISGDFTCREGGLPGPNAPYPQPWTRNSGWAYETNLECVALRFHETVMRMKNCPRLYNNRYSGDQAVFGMELPEPYVDPNTPPFVFTNTCDLPAQGQTGGCSNVRDLEGYDALPYHNAECAGTAFEDRWYYLRKENKRRIELANLSPNASPLEQQGFIPNPWDYMNPRREDLDPDEPCIWRRCDDRDICVSENHRANPDVIDSMTPWGNGGLLPRDFYDERLLRSRYDSYRAKFRRFEQKYPNFPGTGWSEVGGGPTEGTFYPNPIRYLLPPLNPNNPGGDD